MTGLSIFPSTCTAFDLRTIESDEVGEHIETKSFENTVTAKCMVFYWENRFSSALFCHDFVALRCTLKLQAQQKIVLYACLSPDRTCIVFRIVLHARIRCVLV